MISLMLIEDHPLVRWGFRQVVELAGGEMELRSEVESVAEAFRELPRVQPDVVVLDIGLPGENGFEFLHRLRRESSTIPVLVYTGYSAQEFAVRTMQAGASGFLNKSASPEELLSAIKVIAAGNNYLAPSAISLLSRALRDGEGSGLPHEHLSSREYEVFNLIVRGVAVAEIAQTLHISVKTVSSHRSHILNKLGVDSTVAMVRYAMDHGLVT
jgi:two-component system, NarL family, invasion response regulator UvrY